MTVTTSRDPVLRGEWLRARSARLRGRRERPAPPRARQRRARAGGVRLLRLDRGREARVGRPDRARRGRRARLARGARAAGGRRGRAARPAGGRRHRRLQVERPRGVGRRGRRASRSSEHASAASGTSSSSASAAAAATRALAEGVDHLGPVEQARDLLRLRPVADVRVVEDLVERSARARAPGSRRSRAAPPARSAWTGTRTGCGRGRRAWPIGPMLTALESVP